MNLDEKCQALVIYILELSLLHMMSSLYNQAEIAVAAILLARVLLEEGIFAIQFLLVLTENLA
jgi:hypothetical protein